MHVVIILLLGISVCLLLSRFVFSSEQLKPLRRMCYGFAAVLSAMLLYILFLAIVLGNSL